MLFGRLCFDGNYFEKPRFMSLAVTEVHLFYSYPAPKSSKGFPFAPVIFHGNQSERQRLPHGL